MNKNNKKKKLLIISLVVTLLILMGGGTYAYFLFRSNNPVNVTLRINDSNVEFHYDGGSNITGELIPTLTKEEGISKVVTAYSNISSVYIDFYLKINTLPSELNDETFKWELYRADTLISNGNFESYEEDNDYLIGDTINIGTDAVNPDEFTLYLWIDGNVVNNYEMAGKSINFDLYATGSILSRKPASEYITSIYNSASKSSATVNSITYNLAPSVGLMRDRYGSSSNNQDSGNIRYYGANPNNYVWLGDAYTSDYTFTWNGNTITRRSGDKKLWRIIGVFDNQLKLIQNDPLPFNLSWDTSANAAGGNSGYGINQWGPSGTYEGADLMRLLNEEEGLYWAKGTGTVYTGISNATTPNVSFANTGLSQSEKNVIDSVTWYTGAYDNFSYVDVHYQTEHGSMGKICTQGTTDCNDEVTRTSTWNGKVGLMSASDYGYATDLSKCNQTLINYNDSSNNYACRSNDWLYNSSNQQWTLSPLANSSYANRVFLAGNLGSVSRTIASAAGLVRPAVYLKSSVTISGGDGRESAPFRIEN